jgi:hypothetical protein
MDVMNKELENERETLNDETRQRLKDLSKSLLRLHKTLLEGVKANYEKTNGTITSPNQYLQLVLDDAHFAWLRKMSTLIALLDEANSLRRPATEGEAQALLDEAGILMNFKDADEDFNDKFQIALQQNPDAVIIYNETLNFVK